MKLDASTFCETVGILARRFQTIWVGFDGSVGGMLMMSKASHHGWPVGHAAIAECVRFHFITVATDETNVRPIMVEGIDSSRSIRYYQFLPCCSSWLGCKGITSSIMEVKNAKGI